MRIRLLLPGGAPIELAVAAATKAVENQPDGRRRGTAKVGQP